jgi:ribonuclease P protein component
LQKTRNIGKQFTLGKEERLKSRKLIDRVFREGKNFAVFPFRVYYLSVGKADVDRPGGPSFPIGDSSRLQTGFGASSRNFKKAVDRNRIKRLIREAYRLQKDPFYAYLLEKDRRIAVFLIYTGKELPDYQTIYDKIGLTLQRLIKETGG